MTIENRVAVITGATGGLGSVVTQRLAEEGARLALFGRNLERLEQLARGLRLPEDRYLAHTLDLTDPAAAESAAGVVIEKFGRADILLHLVGGWAGGKPVVEVSLDEMSDMIQQHLWTTLYVTQAFVPHLLANQWGRVMVVSSPDASRPPAKRSPYAVAKAAQETLMLSLAQELRDTGVTANVILVRAIDVEHKRAREGESRYASWTTPEEIAAAIVFLCSEEAQMVNGARIPLYGRP